MEEIFVQQQEQLTVWIIYGCLLLLLLQTAELVLMKVHISNRVWVTIVKQINLILNFQRIINYASVTYNCKIFGIFDSIRLRLGIIIMEIAQFVLL